MFPNCEIRTQFRAVPRDVEERQTSSHREGDVVGLCAVHCKSGLQNGRRIILLADSDQQADLAVILGQTIGSAFESAHSGQAGQIGVQRGVSIGLPTKGWRNFWIFCSASVLVPSTFTNCGMPTAPFLRASR